MYGEDDEEKITIDRKTFKTLASDTRIGLLKSLNVRRKTLSELSKEHKMSVSTIKEHLDNLVGAELIVQVDDGHKWKYYELTRKGRAVLNPEERKVWIMLSLSLIAVVAAGLDAVSGIFSRVISGISYGTAYSSNMNAIRGGAEDMITAPVLEAPLAQKAGEAAAEAAADTALGGGAQSAVQATQPVPWVHVILIIIFAVIACYFVYRLWKGRKKKR